MKMKKIFKVFGLGLAVYLGAPSLWYRLISRKVIRNVAEGTVAITFDDGPSTLATRKLLKELKRLNIKATFFVLGSSAKKHPELVIRALKEGHHVGLHGMDHKCHWLMNPIATYKDVRRSKEIISRLGGDPKLFRPPWGLYNLSTVLACKANGLKCVHWSLHAYDWSSHTTEEEIADRIAKKVHSGDIVLLHDGRGEENAPLRTLAAIPGIGKVLEDKALATVRL